MPSILFFLLFYSRSFFIENKKPGVSARARVYSLIYMGIYLKKAHQALGDMPGATAMIIAFIRLPSVVRLVCTWIFPFFSDFMEIIL